MRRPPPIRPKNKYGVAGERRRRKKKKLKLCFTFFLWRRIHSSVMASSQHRCVFGLSLLSFCSFLFFSLHLHSLLGCWEIRMENLIFLVSWFFSAQLGTYPMTLLKNSLFKSARRSAQSCPSGPFLSNSLFKNPRILIFFLWIFNFSLFMSFYDCFLGINSSVKVEAFLQLATTLGVKFSFSFLPMAVVDIWEGK